MENEEWRDIVGYEGLYEVSNIGRVRSLGKRARVMILQKRNKKGKYYGVSLLKDCKQKNMQIHRAVALAFIPNPENKPCVNHIDNDPSNNKLNNLEWVTNRENTIHAVRQGRQRLDNIINRKGEQVFGAKLKAKDILEIRNSSLTQRELSFIYKVSRGNISSIKSRNRWKHI